MRRPHRNDDGTVLLLTMFLGLVLVALVVVVVDVSAAFLARRGLAGQADGAALAAAQQVDFAAFYAGDGDVLPLADADRVVADYVAAHAPGAEVVAVTSDGSTVTVTLRRTLHLPLALPGTPRSVAVVASASARLVRDG